MANTNTIAQYAWWTQTLACGLAFVIGVSIPFTQNLKLEMRSPPRGGVGIATLKVELLNHNAMSLPEFSGEYAAIVRESGFQTPIVWNGKDSIDGLPDRVRLKVTFDGKKNTDIRFNALYVR